MTKKKSIEQLSLLIIEDTPINQKIASAILDDCAIKFKIANNGSEGLALAQQEKFDVILTDIYMPQMNGFQTVQAIRNDSTNPNQSTFITAISSSISITVKQKAKAAGINAFFPKPFSFVMLKEILHLAEVKSNADSNGSTSLDLSKLRLLVKNRSHLVKDMIGIFLQDIPQNIMQITKANQAQHWTELADLTHRIKSNYATLGLNDLHQTATQLESDLRNNDFNVKNINTYVKALVSGTNTILPTLREELNKL